MAEQILGTDFEIHGGGSDLVFPHHENEIAQTEAARAKPLARLWMHNGMVEMDSEKMAKSVGNTRLLHGALEQFGREAFVMWMVGSHYRKPVAYTDEAMADAGRAVARVREAARRLDPKAPPAEDLDALAERFFDERRTTSTRPRPALCLSSGWPKQSPARRRRCAWARGGWTQMLQALGLEGLLEGDGQAAPRRSSRWRHQREEARASRDFEAPDACATRSQSAAGIRDTADGGRLVGGLIL